MKKLETQIPQEKFHVKKNDEVVVIAGSNRGQRGKVLQILKKKNRLLIEGVNMIKKATRKSHNQPEGGLVEREGSIHISNVMLASRYDGRKKAAKSA